MILLCGIPSEPPIARVREELDDLDVPHVVFNQRRTDNADIEFTIADARVGGTLTLDGQTHDLASISGVYTRMMDAVFVPEIAGAPEASPRRNHSLAVHEAMLRWLETTPAVVINRADSMSSNHSKPYQAQLIMSHGFAVPETLITNQPDLVEAFYRQHGRVVYKSISGTRSIVSELSEDDLARLDRITWCPVQFQQYVSGLDVRVHVIGEGTLATAVHASHVDYRYTHREENGEVELNPFLLDDSVANSCVNMTREMGLVFSGIDLRISEDGKIYCFEVNPSPAFTYYESHTSQPIARAVANYLASADEQPESDREPSGMTQGRASAGLT